MRTGLPPLDTLGAEYQFMLLAARPDFTSRDARALGDLLKGDLDWQAVLFLAQEHRLACMMHANLHAIERDGELDVLPRLLSKGLKAYRQQTIKKNLMLSSSLVRIVQCLQQHDIPVLPLKGPILALQAYRDLSLRPSNDLDVLISQGDLQRCQKVLAEKFGLQADHPPLAAMTAKQLQSYCNVIYETTLRTPKGQLVVDLHWRVDRFGHEYFAATADPPLELTDTTLGGHHTPCIPLLDLMPYLCRHGSKHYWQRLFWVCDLAMVLHRYPNFDWQAVVTRAKTVDDLRSVLLGMRLAQHLFGARLPSTISNELVRHPVVDRLAAEVCTYLFQGPLNKPVNVRPRAPLFDLGWQIRLHQRWRAKIGISLNSVFEPGYFDWTWLRFPDALFTLYYVMRPVRLLIEYARQYGRALSR